MSIIGNPITVDTGAERRTLLWTNASPDAAFPAQTINLDLSRYEEIEIVYSRHEGSVDYGTKRDRVFKGDSSRIMFCANSESAIGNRFVDVGTDRIIFGDARLDSSINNYTCVPEHIYGIKVRIR